MMKKIIVISVLCVSCLILVNAHADMVSTSVSGNKTLLEGHDYPDSKRKISLNRQNTPTIQPIQTISNASRHYGLRVYMSVHKQVTVIPSLHNIRGQDITQLIIVALLGV